MTSTIDNRAIHDHIWLGSANRRIHYNFYQLLMKFQPHFLGVWKIDGPIYFFSMNERIGQQTDQNFIQHSFWHKFWNFCLSWDWVSRSFDCHFMTFWQILKYCVDFQIYTWKHSDARNQYESNLSLEYLLILYKNLSIRH